MPSLIYNSFLENLARGQIDPDTDTFRVMLTTSAYSENKDTHDFRDDVTNEITGTGYSAGGALATVSVNRDNATDRVEITLGGVSWPASTITARKAVYYKARGGAASADELVAIIDFGSDVSSTGAAFTLGASTIRFQN